MKQLENTILNKLSEIYIFLILIVFPLVVDHTGYFHILEFKWNVFTLFTVSYIFITILVFLYFLIAKKINFFKGKKLSIFQKLMIIFLIINALSCFLSPYFSTHNLIIGSGRLEGLLVQVLYILSFLFLTFFAKLEKRYLLYFSISSILFSLICILQYIGFNPFNIYHDGIGTYNTSFIGTIGNVDFVSAYYVVFLTISFSCFIFLEEEFWRKIIHYLSFILGFFIFGVISVKSGVVGFAGTLILILPLLFANNKYAYRYVLIIAAVIFAYAFNIFMNPVYYYKYAKLVLEWNFNMKFAIMLFLVIIIVILGLIIKNTKFDFSKRKDLLKKYYIFLGSSIILALLFLFIVDFKSGFLHEIHELLHGNFDDNYGTYRVFLWKRTLKMITRPILGIGPDAFVIPFMERYTEDIISIGPYAINDTAANIYLTMLINIGLSGLIVYLAFLFNHVKTFIKNCNDISKVLIVAIIAYSIQAFFNLSVVLVTPFIYVLFALHSISYIDNKKKKN